MMHVVVAAVLHQDDQVLLCHRSPAREWFPDVWDFPGGHLEAGETHSAALARELDEELGIVPLHVDATPLIVKTGDDLDLSVYRCTRWRGKIRNRQRHEHDRIGWFNDRELDGLDFADPAYLPALGRLLRCRPD